MEEWNRGSRGNKGNKMLGLSSTQYPVTSIKSIVNKGESGISELANKQCYYPILLKYVFSPDNRYSTVDYQESDYN